MTATDFLDAPPAGLTPQPAALKAEDFLGAPMASDFLAPQEPALTDAEIQQRIAPKGIDFQPTTAPLDAVQKVQLQSGLQDPEYPSGAKNDTAFLSAMSEGGNPVAFAKNLASLPLTTPGAYAGEVAEEPGARLLNALGYDLMGGVPFKPFKAGEPIIPPPADDAHGILPAIQRAASGLSTPGGLLTLGMAPESKAVQGMFLAGAVGSVPDSLDKMATAKNGGELRDAATELGMNVGMAFLLRHGADLRALPEGPVMTPEQAAANAAAVRASLPVGFAGGVSRGPAAAETAPASMEDLEGLQAAMERNQINPAAQSAGAAPQTLGQKMLEELKLGAAEPREPARIPLSDTQADSLRDLGFSGDDITKLQDSASLAADGKRIVLDPTQARSVIRSALRRAGIDTTPAAVFDDTQAGLLSHESSVNDAVEQAYGDATEVFNSRPEVAATENVPAAPAPATLGQRMLDELRVAAPAAPQPAPSSREPQIDLAPEQEVIDKSSLDVGDVFTFAGATRTVVAKTGDSITLQNDAGETKEFPIAGQAGIDTGSLVRGASLPLTTSPESAKTTLAPAAPGTSTVRSVGSNAGNERQRGRVQGNPGMTAESGSNPDLGATAGQLQFQDGQQVVVKLRDSGAEHMARIVQMQPDGSATVKLDREDGYRQVQAGQIFKTKSQVAREAKAEEIAGLAPEQQAQVKADAAEFVRLFKAYGPHPDVDWIHPEVLSESDVKSQSIEKSQEMAAGMRRAMRDLGMPEGEPRSVVDQARALPRLREFLESKGIAAVDPKRAEAFNKDVSQKSRGTKPLSMDDLQEGAQFLLKGAKFTVRKLAYDEDGRITHVILDDGKKYGTQEFFNQEPLRMDIGTQVRTPWHVDEMKEERPPYQLESPESVEEQNARLAAEEKARLERSQREDAQARATKALSGGTGDLGQKDLFGGGDLFSLHESRGDLEARKSELDPIANDLYGKDYDDLTENEKGNVLATLESEDAAQHPELPRRQPNPGRRNNRREQPAPESQPVPPAPAKAARPEIETGTLEDSVESRLRQLTDELKFLREKFKYASKQSEGGQTYPSSSQGVGILAQIRYNEGQLDLLRHIANAEPELKQSWFRKFLEGDAPDAIERILDRLINVTELKQGRLLEGITGAPVWITKAMANAALRIVRAAYQGGKALAEAIEDGVAWLRENAGKSFNEGEARAWLDSLRGQINEEERGSGPKLDYEQLKARRDEINARLGEIAQENAEQRTSGLSLPAELRAERFRLAKESRDINKQLLKRPEHVAALLKQLDTWRHNYAVALREGNKDVADKMRDEIFSAVAPESELSKADPDLVDRVRRQLEAAGEITKSPEPTPGGRTLGSVVDWLRQNKVDSPKPSLREQLNVARRLQEEWDKGKTAVQKITDSMAAMWQAFKAQYRQPPVDTDFLKLLEEWRGEKDWTGLETYRWLSEIKRQIPSKLRRMAVAVFVDAGGHEGLLREQLQYLPAKWRPVWETALKLKDSEKALGHRISADLEQKLGDAQLAGLLDRGREHYGMPQVWERPPKHEEEFDPFAEKNEGPKSARNPKAKLDPRAPFFALRRTSPSYFDGIMAGGVPKSLDVADLVGLYNREFHNSLADRGVIFAMKNAKAMDGRPVIQISGMAQVLPTNAGGRIFFVDSNWRPKEATAEDGRPYRVVDHWALRDWKFASKDASGNPIVVRGDFLVHPDHYKVLRNELEQSWLRNPDRGGKIFNPILNSAAYLKASKFAAASFHMATIAEHSFFHAFAGLPTRERLSLLNPSIRGIEVAPEKDPELLELMRNNLALGFDGQQELFEEGVASHGGILSKVPGLGDALRMSGDFLWKRFIPAIKVRAAKVILHANMARYKAELSAGQIYRLTASQVNAGFGGQRLLGRSKTFIDVNRLLFTAPDFLLSRSKVVAQALKPYNREQLLFLLAQAGLVYTGARAANIAFSENHDPHWEPENAFSVVIQGRAYSARFIVSDALGFANDVFSFGRHGYGATLPFLAGRIGPVPKTVYESVTGHDMRTGREIHTYFQSGVLRAGELAGRDIGSWFIPVGAEGLLPGARQQDQSMLGQLGLALLGIGSHPYPAVPNDKGGSRRK